MNIEDIKTVLILGSGTMGQQIGFLCAFHGYRVIYFDIEKTTLETASANIKRLAEKFVAKKGLSAEHVESAMARMTFTTNAQDAGKDVDFVSESIPEDPELKGRVFAQFNDICPAHTIFTTNTSSLVPSMFSKATGRPEKFAALHFHNILQNVVVDIMPHSETGPETVDLIYQFAKGLDLIPIMLKKEYPGYIFNTMLSALLQSAQALVANDIASFQDVDRSWMGVMGTHIGPFGLIDSIGLDTVWKITELRASENNDPEAKVCTDLLKKYLDKGHLGVKKNQGFYSYPNPAFLKPGFLIGED